MADVKISQLPAATTPLAGTEEIPLVQSTTTKKVTVTGLLTTANLGTPTAINLTNATNVPVNQATGVLPVVNGGTGVTTPNIIGGTNISVTGTWPNQTVSATGSAAGNVTGPTIATDNAVARYDNTTGQIIQNSGVIISDTNVITGGTWNGTPIAVSYGGTGTSTPSIVAGTNVTVSGTWPNQTINASGGGGGSGTVTDMSIVSANGLAGTVATSTTTPAVTLSTTVTGVVKGNGTALSAATAGTDYVAPGGALGTPSSGTATNLTGLPLTTGVTGLLPVANGGTGTATPAIVAGTNVTVSGTWPNQTINASSSAQVYPGAGIANSTGTAWGTSYTTTGTGTVLALSTSPTFVTPALGTPSALVGTNITGTAAGLTAGNVTTNANLTGAVTSVGNATSLGSFSSANLLAALTDETGTGSAVFATSPTLVTPILGTPQSATLTNATGLPIATGVSGLGTGVATFLATPSSANLASAVTGETGTGALVFGTAPALSNPTVTAYTETVYALSGTAIDPANGTIQTKTLGASTTFTESLADGQSVVLMVNPVTYTVTWPTITWINTAGSGAAPTLEASSMNVVVMWQVAGTVYGNWVGSA